ncbi:putative 2-(R)-hydroxypropyl-CoM dehydrogenase [Chaetomium strumarium]|uniref:2-(R)-hydroxypropyl-CoM dehydrogenase n=1 Tax=Chaetomium strumarium TaxID=1170767 RepID=A0AAJ0GYX5_9PEZI|nr:putative 2-(R)-hydroxypropyl-CoM dehydrogenase [Chaetomium strumarium]
MAARVANKVCIVTGASSGIGRAIALLLAREGAAYVLCADLRPGYRPSASEDIPATHELITQEYGEDRAGFRQVDVTVEEQVKGMVAEVVQRAGRLDVIVSNAGVGPPWTPLHEMSDDMWSGTFNVNTRATFLCSKYAIRQFLQQELPHEFRKRGCIINIASAAGLREVKLSSAYCASKAAVISLTKATALEYGSARIQCNAICPGTVLTPMTAPMLSNDLAMDFFKAVVPWGDGGVDRGPEEIAYAAAWLASEEAGWVTGVALPVDGGFSVHA